MRLCLFRDLALVISVSIHAPTRGATEPCSQHAGISVCFNPRTYTRCDAYSGISAIIQLCFNPRTYTRCDIDAQCFKLSLEVSIHAPTRGATQSGGKIGISQQVSIHAPTRGATKTACLASLIIHLFQSTHLHEVRLVFGSLLANATYSFNPRTYTRCD